MSEGPAIAEIAALIGDPARAEMLSVLMDGRARTAGELASVAGVTPQTASTHLARMAQAGLLSIERQGRHRYHRLSSREVSAVLEQLMVLGAVSRKEKSRRLPGPRDPALRQARTCYDHMAGTLAVAQTDAFLASGWIEETQEGIWRLTSAGREGFEALGAVLPSGNDRRLIARPCLDWSERRAHLGGALGAAWLDLVLERGWFQRVKNSRALAMTAKGEAKLAQLKITLGSADSQ